MRSVREGLILLALSFAPGLPLALMAWGGAVVEWSGPDRGAALAVAGVVAVLHAAVVVFAARSGATQFFNEQTLFLTAVAPRPFLLAFVVVAAVFEEAIFRGVVMPALARSCSTVPAILVTAMLFALVHRGVGPRAAVLLFAAGVVFGGLAWIEGGVLAAIVSHATMNVVVVLGAAAVTSRVAGGLPPGWKTLRASPAMEMRWAWKEYRDAIDSAFCEAKTALVAMSSFADLHPCRACSAPLPPWCPQPLEQADYDIRED